MSDHGTGPVPLAVFDIDGVLADVRHRLHHIRGGARDWTGFFSAMGDDVVLEQGRHAVEQAQGQGLAVAYLTGRPEGYRGVTQAWLVEQGLPPGPVVMRPDRDRRPARVFKAQALRTLARRAPIAYIVDDDADVVETLEAAGYVVRRADWMPPDIDLYQAQEGSGRS